MQAALPEADLPPEARAAARRLAADTLRHWGRAGAALKPVLRRTPDARTEALLRLAVTELMAQLSRRTPPGSR